MQRQEIKKLNESGDFSTCASSLYAWCLCFLLKKMWFSMECREKMLWRVFTNWQYIYLFTFHPDTLHIIMRLPRLHIKRRTAINQAGGSSSFLPLIFRVFFFFLSLTHRVPLLLTEGIPYFMPLSPFLSDSNGNKNNFHGMCILRQDLILCRYKYDIWGIYLISWEFVVLSSWELVDLQLFCEPLRRKVSTEQPLFRCFIILIFTVPRKKIFKIWPMCIFFFFLLC